MAAVRGSAEGEAESVMELHTLSAFVWGFICNPCQRVLLQVAQVAMLPVLGTGFHCTKQIRKLE